MVKTVPFLNMKGTKLAVRIVSQFGEESTKILTIE